MSLELWRRRYRKAPITAVKRELLSVEADPPELPDDAVPAPVLCVTGDAAGAAVFAANWLPHIAQRGHAAHAVSVRGQGGTPKGDGGRDGKVHDVVQAAAALPSRCILIGHDLGALWVAHAITRYPAVCAILLAPKGLTKAPASPLGECRVIVAGSPDDKKSGPKVLDRAAQAYQGAPLLFPGIGHDVMNDPNWQQPLDAILDWISEPVATPVS
ncbi:alpha/beta hydrolase [Stackebrandtia soli]|uniref:alpha/beta hydrolase n=1 Tax=Stackebrandtia soli TaxID=1892856 RepID=UPI0039EB7655